MFLGLVSRNDIFLGIFLGIHLGCDGFSRNFLVAQLKGLTLKLVQIDVDYATSDKC